MASETRSVKSANVNKLRSVIKLLKNTSSGLTISLVMMIKNSKL